MPLRALPLVSLASLATAAWLALDPDRAPLAGLLVALALLLAAVAWLESGPASVQDLALVATLGGLAAAGRVLFAPVPQVQPVTVIVAAAGAALGPKKGFAVGALAAVASNVVLGQGPYTPWQMLAWGGCGVAAGLARRVLSARMPFALFCCALGFAYGVPMDLYTWLYLPHDAGSFTVVFARGLPFNTAHAIGNLVIALAAGPELRRVLARFERRSRAEVVWA